jgi:hypothetical protein
VQEFEEILSGVGVTASMTVGSTEKEIAHLCKRLKLLQPVVIEKVQCESQTELNNVAILAIHWD